MKFLIPLTFLICTAVIQLPEAMAESDEEFLLRVYLEELFLAFSEENIAEAAPKRVTCGSDSARGCRGKSVGSTCGGGPSVPQGTCLRRGDSKNGVVCACLSSASSGSTARQ